MKMPIANSHRGFSLLELMVASTIGLIAIVAMTSLFRTGMNATFTVTQRAETQQNMRAAIELMTKDISMAGAGLPSGGLQLATTGGNSKVACNQAGTCYVPADTYPTGNYMYGLLPGFGNGVQSGTTITSAPGATNDSVTSIYCDYNFPLTNFSFTFPSTTQATVGPPIAPAVVIAGLPTNILAPGGLNVGDLMFFLVTTPGPGTAGSVQGTSSAQTAAVVAEITGLPNNTTIDFATGDALNFNQTGANSLANTITTLGPALGGGNAVTACRLNAVTYFLQVPLAGGTVQTPRLMRQVNGLTAVPVADNIINLQFSYDVISSTGGLMNANLANPIAVGDSPALIQKVNMWVMGQSLVSSGSRFQSMYLASSVSTGNMSFCNSYSSNTTVCQ
ncbi:MAG TPA: prepilin-type N-terminal cleavage/methylation domain-containing protein [Chthoniobacterales bacterium]|nr:prepilin-type N-terminal cleavage/methylation domain-containing protein [Chthoniobacterales bacterium]